MTSGPLKVLVVEDHPTDRKLALEVLRAAGFSVTAAEDSEIAFFAIEEQRPEVILLDMSLPGMDGMALLQKLKADPHTSDIHVVGFTCFPERYPKNRALEAGCDAYLVKPINTRDLPHQLASIVAPDRRQGFQA